MAYNLGWSTSHPGHLVYLIDLSGSMNIDNRYENLLDVLLKVCNRLCYINKDDDGDPIEQFTLSIIGYNSEVEILKSNISVRELNEMRTQAMRGGKLIDYSPRWQTYTAKAFEAATEDVKNWIAGNPNIPKPAPIVIHITDGVPYEEELKNEPGAAVRKALLAAEALKSVSVPDGNVLLFNIHIEPGKPASRFLSTPPSDEHLRFLYETSSIMDSVMAAKAQFALAEFRTMGVETDKIVNGSRFMVSNETNKDILARLIVFGSSVSMIAQSIEYPKPI